MRPVLSENLEVLEDINRLIAEFEKRLLEENKAFGVTVFVPLDEKRTDYDLELMKEGEWGIYLVERLERDPSPPIPILKSSKEMRVLALHCVAPSLPSLEGTHEQGARRAQDGARQASRLRAQHLRAARSQARGKRLGIGARQAMSKTHCGSDDCGVGDVYSLEDCGCWCDRCGGERIRQLREREARGVPNYDRALAILRDTWRSIWGELTVSEAIDAMTAALVLRGDLTEDRIAAFVGQWRGALFKTRERTLEILIQQL